MLWMAGRHRKSWRVIESTFRASGRPPRTSRASPMPIDISDWRAKVRLQTETFLIARASLRTNRSRSALGVSIFFFAFHYPFPEGSIVPWDGHANIVRVNTLDKRVPFYFFKFIFCTVFDCARTFSYTTFTMDFHFVLHTIHWDKLHSICYSGLANFDLPINWNFEYLY